VSSYHNHGTAYYGVSIQKDFVKILCVNGAITLISNCHLPAVLTVLRDVSIESKDFVKILCVGGAITLIADGCLPTVINVLRVSGIEPKDFVKILCVCGAITVIDKGKYDASVVALRCARPTALCLYGSQFWSVTE
jgi:hypothetical protein